ncbi:MAG: hypothetical protein AVO33_00575 [delta proteobacterium ML8_F1]|nr:MAG: hypothetical protein AVO33_00575 [delta proteobacterium ML8_F1]
MEKRKMIVGENIFIALLLLFSALTLYFAIQILKKEVSFSSPGFFPVFVSSIMFITGIMIWREMKHLSPNHSDNRIRETLNAMVNKRVVVTIIVVLLYASLLEWIGFELATLLFLFSIMLFFKAGNWKKVLFVSGVTVGLVVVVFSTIFNVILP